MNETNQPIRRDAEGAQLKKLLVEKQKLEKAMFELLQRQHATNQSLLDHHHKKTSAKKK